MKAVPRLIVALSLAGCLAASGVRAQDGWGNGRLTGEVRDEDGNPLAGVKVALLHIESETVREVVTNQKGKWTLMGLGGGVWKVILTLDGYRPRIEEAYVHSYSRSDSVQSVLKKAPSKEASVNADLGLVEEGYRLFADKRYEDAVGVFREFLARHPDRFRVHFSIGRCYKEAGEYDQAQAEYAKVLDKIREINPALTGDALVGQTLAAQGEIALKRGERDAAQTLFAKALALYPSYASLPFDIGDIYYGNDLFEEAAAYYALAIRVKPRWPDPWLKLGLAQLKAHNRGEARNSLATYLKLAPQASDADDIRALLESLGKN
jgi:tetratricopeptide (TPR) repeat protein